jgi:hypothetical protein
MNSWWGYIHINKSIQVKRYFNHSGITNARQSDLVEKVYLEFPARDRNHAIEQIEHWENSKNKISTR